MQSARGLLGSSTRALEEPSFDDHTRRQTAGYPAPDRRNLAQATRYTVEIASIDILAAASDPLERIWQPMIKAREVFRKVLQQ